jgi:hypothetical protein
LRLHSIAAIPRSSHRVKACIDIFGVAGKRRRGITDQERR